MMAELLFEIFRGKDFTREQWEVAIAVTAVLLVIFAIVVNRIQNRKIRQTNECLTREALKWHGKRDVDTNSMTFDHNGTEIVVAWGAVKQGPWVYASFQRSLFPDFAFTVASNKGRDLISLFSGDGIEIIDGFTIKSNNEPLVRVLLTPEMQQNLLSYRPRMEIVFGNTRLSARTSFLGYSVRDFGYEPGRLFLFVFRLFKEDSDCDALIKTTMMFYEKLESMAHLPLHTQMEPVEGPSTN
jgi:hypothetical protein